MIPGPLLCSRVGNTAQRDRVLSFNYIGTFSGARGAGGSVVAVSVLCICRPDVGTEGAWMFFRGPGFFLIIGSGLNRVRLVYAISWLRSTIRLTVGVVSSPSLCFQLTRGILVKWAAVLLVDLLLLRCLMLLGTEIEFIIFTLGLKRVGGSFRFSLSRGDGIGTNSVKAGGLCLFSIGIIIVRGCYILLTWARTF